MEIQLPESIQSPSKENQPWLLAYSDMVTLLLAFFVLFFAISQLDPVKFEVIMDYFNQNQTMPLHVLEEKFDQLVQAHQLQESVEVELTPEGLLVNFQDNLLLDSGKANLKENSFPVLGAMADIIKAEDVVERKIQVEGHTDTVPLSDQADYPSNWELSTARSSSVIRYFITRNVSSSRFMAVGFADTRLRESETSDNRGLSVNRRVSLLIK
ncbi:OmpA family protein [bacterium]|nr:OmpA family protein [bacterium]